MIKVKGGWMHVHPCYDEVIADATSKSQKKKANLDKMERNERKFR